MSTPPENNRTTNKVRIRSNKRLLNGVIAVFVVAVAGSYALYSAKADMFHTPNLVYIDATQSKNIKTTGNTFELPFYSDVPNTPDPDTYPYMRLTVHIWSKGPVEYADYKCGSVGPCSKTLSLIEDDGEWKGDIVLCVDVKPSNFGTKHVPLFNIVYKKGAKTGQYEVKHSTTKDPYSCDNTRGPRNGGYYIDTGNYGETGPGFGFSTGTNGTDTTSNNTTSTTGTGGGGSSGSTAKIPSNNSNSTPSTSSQGNNKQPALQPSPFYDGRQYTPGSDPIDKTFGNISVAGRKIAHGWLYLTGLAIIVVSSAGYYWWWKKKGPT